MEWGVVEISRLSEGYPSGQSTGLTSPNDNFIYYKVYNTFTF